MDRNADPFAIVTNSYKKKEMEITKFIECDSQVETCFYDWPPCLAKYTVQKILGEGSYGVVYDVGEYVIKCIPVGTKVCDFCVMSTKAQFKLESFLTSYLNELGFNRISTH